MSSSHHTAEEKPGQENPDAGTGEPPASPADTREAVLAEFADFASRHLFQLSPDAILVTDAAGMVRAANPRTAEMFGYPAAELIGLPIDALVPERYRGRHPAHREAYCAQPRTRQMGAALKLFALRKDGSEFPVDIMLKPVETTFGPVVLSFVRDITGQHAALEALRANQQQLRSVIDSVRDYAIYLLDPEGYVATWNPGGERIKGYTADEILGQHFSRFFTPEDVARGRPQELMRLAAQRGRVEDQGWRLRKDGSRFWTDSILSAIRDSTGQITGYSKVTRDFTDRKRAEEAIMLQLSSALLANLDASTLLDAISASVRELIACDLVGLALYDPGQGNLAMQMLGEVDRASFPRELRFGLEDSAAGLAFRTREPVLIETMASPEAGEPAVRETVSSMMQLGMECSCAVPLIHRGEAIGALTVASRIPGAIGGQQAEMLAQMADQVAMAVSNAIAFRRIAELRDRLGQEKRYLEDEINLEGRFDDVVGESMGLRRVLSEIETVAPTDATVLIQGETGTGKELLARAIHRLSPRSERTFIKINCAAIPAGLIESELFGHEKGAFTGAIARKIGRLELAHEGTLFLDEVGELPLELQPKLLRALQEREIERVGGNRAILVNVRLIAATNRDLAQMVADRQFRSDLYYRLKVFPVFAPPLRERAGDIPILVRHFVETHARRMGKHITTIPEATMAALAGWHWPGNIRELENFLERAVILTRGPVLYVPLAELEVHAAEVAETLENPTLQAAEREHILRVLREADGQVGGPNGAAARLGLKRTTLNSKMKKLGIERSDSVKPVN
jgi:formate hydrogenlyase transcriptional activator